MKPFTFQRTSLRRTILTVCITLTIGVACTMVQAQVDQRNDAFDPNLFDSIEGLGPIGQEFIPTLSSLKFADLFTQDLDPTDNSGALLYIHVHDGTISGPILGTSMPLFLPDGFSGVTHFEFPSAISLVPGDLYILEPVVSSGENWGVGRTDEFPVDTYPPGRPITLGQPEPGGTADLWFREGVTDVPPVVPESSSLALLTAGAVGLLLLGRRGPDFGRMPSCRRIRDDEMQTARSPCLKSRKPRQEQIFPPALHPNGCPPSLMKCSCSAGHRSGHACRRG